jgi:hypothetical protein
MIEKLRDAVFKMRSYAETTGGDYSLGFESGLEMAAGMIENILNASRLENNALKAHKEELNVIPLSRNLHH